MKQNKVKIRITTQFNLEVSEEYLMKLQYYPFSWAIRENCFRNNTKTNIIATMEVLQNATPISN